MSYKVLLADDSLTIQKVIKITLANEPYELIECNNDSDLFSKLNSENPSMVFLDFTLSDDKSGYELCNEIKKIKPNVKVLMMYGTFDTIDEAEFKASGASDKIVKPFDSTKFINICRNLVNDDDSLGESSQPTHAEPSDDSDFPDVIEENIDLPDDLPEDDIPDPIDEVDDEWTMNAPSAEIESESIDDIPEEIPEVQAKNQLESEIEDWGMEVPGVIGGEESEQDLPPVMGSEPTQAPSPEPQQTEEPVSEPVAASEEGDDALPSDEDLEYPDMGEPSSMFTSTDDLNEVEEDIIEEEIAEESDINELEAAIEDEDDSDWSADGPATSSSESAEEDIDDIWAADDAEPESPQPQVMQEDGPTQIQDDLPDDISEEEISQPSDADLEYPDVDNLDEFDSPIYEDRQVDPPMRVDEAVSEMKSDVDEVPHAIENPSLDGPVGNIDINALRDEILQEVRANIREIVAESVKEYLSGSTEKVAWEIIPDLAENIIKTEIQKISNSVK